MGQRHRGVAGTDTQQAGVGHNGEGSPLGAGTDDQAGPPAESLNCGRAADFSGQILGTADPTKGPALLYDLVTAAQSHIPHSGFIAAFGILLIGMIAGLEGSGFSGLPLTGSLAGSLGPAAGISAGTLAAVGQMGNIWSGGGTLVVWSSLIAVAGFARVPVIALARRCFIPVVSGLIVGTIVAVVFFP
ncbi:hypothetical protein [Micromonospora sp. NPDC003776]